MPYPSPSFMKTVIQHFQHSVSHFQSRAKIYRWLKQIKEGVTDAQSKSLPRDMGLKIVDKFVDVLCQCPYRTSKC